MANETSFYKLCRICTNETDGISIYSNEGRENRLEEKIKKFLSIQVSEEDILPKTVCSLCSSKLESINQLAATAAKTQIKLMEYLKSHQIKREEYDQPKFSQFQPKIWDVDLDEESDMKEGVDTDSSSDKEDEIKGSLLHSILTKGQSYPSNDITELEVTVDPMLFIEEGEEDIEDITVNSPDSNDSSLENDSNSNVLAELKPYQCTICPRGFNSDVSLRNHLWNHLPSRKFLSTADIQRFQIPTTFQPTSKLFNTQCLCQVCGRVYPTKSTLRAHQITHSNLRPHKCTLCEKTFKRNQDLKFHINQHTGERPYRCPYCPKAFASSGNCFSHRKRMHPKQLAKDKQKIIH